MCRLTKWHRRGPLGAARLGLAEDRAALTSECGPKSRNPFAAIETVVPSIAAKWVASFVGAHIRTPITAPGGLGAGA